MKNYNIADYLSNKKSPVSCLLPPAFSFMKLKITLIILIFIIFSFTAPAEEKKHHLIYGVPYEAQPAGQPYCGPASLYMVLKYWEEDTDITQADLVDEVFNSFFGGTIPYPIKRYLGSRGYIVRDMRCKENIDEIKKYILKDIPVIVVNSMTPIDNKGHFRVVIGFDDKKKEIITHDPALGLTYTMTYEEFFGCWKYYKRYMLVCYPPDYEKILSLKTPYTYQERTGDMDAKVYGVYSRAYLRAGYYDRAVREAEKGLSSADDYYIKLNLLFFQAEGLIESGYTNKAKKALQEGIEGKITDIPYACYFMALIYYEEGNYDECLYYSKIAVEGIPDYGKAHLILGKCRKKIGQNEMAKISFQKALELDINLREALDELNDMN